MAILNFWGTSDYFLSIEVMHLRTGQVILTAREEVEKTTMTETLFRPRGRETDDEWVGGGGYVFHRPRKGRGTHSTGGGGGGGGRGAAIRSTGGAQSVSHSSLHHHHHQGDKWPKGLISWSRPQPSRTSYDPVSASSPAWSRCNWEEQKTGTQKAVQPCTPRPNQATAQLPGSQTDQARAKPGRSTRSRKTNDPQPFWLVQQVREVCPHRLTSGVVGWPLNDPPGRPVLVLVDVHQRLVFGDHSDLSLLSDYDDDGSREIGLVGGSSN
ncbi:hypothetical protein F1880_001097 [Penicillium rolfsii]|nr:hypothetical protein F1880_001097 [Penicillium rolfsii]